MPGGSGHCVGYFWVSLQLLLWLVAIEAARICFSPLQPREKSLDWHKLREMFPGIQGHGPTFTFYFHNSRFYRTATLKADLTSTSWSSLIALLLSKFNILPDKGKKKNRTKKPNLLTRTQIAPHLSQQLGGDVHFNVPGVSARNCRVLSF